MDTMVDPQVPRYSTPLIGRAKETADVIDVLRRPSTRLVTLLGESGTGKTRLSTEIAFAIKDDFADGVFFVALAAISDPALVAQSIAHTLHIPEKTNEPLLDTVAGALAGKAMLLILDNIEQVIEAAGDILSLIERTERLKILVTSQVELAIAPEVRFPIPRLSVPQTHAGKSLDELAGVPAIALFIDRVTAVQPTFKLTGENVRAIMQICSLVEGLPLAIELVAAHSRALSPPDLLVLLRNHLALRHLLPTRAGRPSILKTILDWSYTMLGPGLQLLFARLGIFVGGWTLDAVAAICNQRGDLSAPLESGMRSLVEQCLVLEEDVPGQGTRYTMLDAIRLYADGYLKKLPDQTALLNRHAAFYATLAAQGDAGIKGPDRVAWFNRLEADHANIRSALQWSAARHMDGLLVELAAHMGIFWFRRGYYREGKHWLERASGTGDAPHKAPGAPAGDPLLRATAMRWLGVLHTREANYDAATAILRRCIGLYEDQTSAEGLGNVYNDLGVIALNRTEYDQAQRWFEASLGVWRERGDQARMAIVLSNLGIIHHDQGRYAEARPLYEESLALNQATGNVSGEVLARLNLGALLEESGYDHEQARVHATEALAVGRELGDRRVIAQACLNLSAVAAADRDLAAATAYAAESLAIYREINEQRDLIIALERCAGIRRAQRRWAVAAALLAAAEHMRSTLAVPFTPSDRNYVKSITDELRQHLDQAALDGTRERAVAAGAQGTAAAVSDFLAEAGFAEPPK